MLNRREWLARTAGLAPSIATLSAQSGGRSARPRPNIVVILCDDLGYGDVSSYNAAAKLRTPRIDKLASEGVRFTDAHSPSSVCTPTRYGLLTGRYCWRSALKRGVLNGESPSLIESGRSTIASVAKQNGYRTGCFGKWHLGLGTNARTNYAAELNPSPLDFGFDEFFGIPASLDMPPYLWVQNRRAVELPTSTIADNGEVKRGPFWRGGPIAPGFKMDDVVPEITNRACRFIRDNAGQPFLAYVPIPAPHTPWVPARTFRGKSAAGLYGDFVEQTDSSIGAILDQLEQSGAANNTLVIVTSDNGAPWEKRDSDEAAGHWANANWRGQKADIYEAGHRIPLLVRWPGVAKAGAVSNQLVCLTDIFATLADAQFTPLGPKMAEDSFTFRPALAGKSSAREAIVHHSSQGLFSIRKGPWKLVLGRGSGGFTEPAKIDPKPGEPEGELYNLANDPQERQNLYSLQPGQVARLRGLLQQYELQGFSRPMRAS